MVQMFVNKLLPIRQILNKNARSKFFSKKRKKKKSSDKTEDTVSIQINKKHINLKV